MKGLITIEVNNHRIDFDFDKYTYGFNFNIADTPEERLRIMQEIEQNPDYKLLRKYMFAKHDFENIPNSSQEEYRKVLGEFADWCLSKQERKSC